MKNQQPLLIDLIYRATFNKETVPGWQSNIDMRHALERAKRFIADRRMSAFMADLAHESFLKNVRLPKLNCRICDSLRVSSRLPHDAIWIEYYLYAYQERLRAIQELAQENTPKLSLWKEGWLIQQHPKIDTAYTLHVFTQEPKGNADESEVYPWTFPFAFAWCCDDSPLPWRVSIDPGVYNVPDKVICPISEYLTGITGYKRDNVGCIQSPLIVGLKPEDDEYNAHLLGEWRGVLREVWSLLATIDHLPIIKNDVRQTKGFLAQHRIRKFLSHQSIALNIPAKKDTRVVARQAIAITHRKRHEVRGHWRDDWRNPPSQLCNPHLWENWTTKPIIFAAHYVVDGRLTFTSTNVAMLHLDG
jgi:hypothetical protein